MRAFRFMRRGFNLVEAAIVLGIVGLVIGGIWVAASAVAENHRWQQTEAGWLYYMDTVGKMFPKSVVSSSDFDINQQLSASIPPPAGWSLGLNNRPKDPYGRLLIMQVLGTTGVFYAGYQEPLSNPSCVNVFKLVIGKLFKGGIVTPTYFTAQGSGPNGACTLVRNSYADYDDGSYMSKCCPNSGIGFYAQLPN